MKRSTLGIVLPILFISGIMIGAYGGMKLTKRQVRGYAGQGPQMYLYRLINDLDLTEEQKRTVEASMNLAREASDELNAEYFPRMQTIISNSCSEILGQLTPEQREALETKKEEMQKRWEERRRRPPRRRSGTNTVHRGSRHGSRPPRKPPEEGGEKAGTGIVEEDIQP